MISLRTCSRWLLLSLLLSLAGVQTAHAERPARVVSGRERPRPLLDAVQDRAALQKPVEVRLMVIHCTNQQDGFDPPIQNLKKHLGFLNYKGFKLLLQENITLTLKSTRSIGLFDGRVLELTMNSVTAERAVLQVRMYNPQAEKGVALNTTVSVTRKGTFFVGGPRYGDGVLMLPITAWY